MVKYFTIYGERCSGTNFLEHAIKDNFELEFTAKYVWKHFYGHYNFENKEEDDETLYIGLVRNPIYWIDSFYAKKHHVPIENKININTFLFNTFYSVYDDGSEIMEDKNIKTKERYKNIFEMRKIKNDYLINDMKNNVKNYLLLRYEDLRDNYDIILDFIKNKFNLTKKNTFYKKIDSYKGKNNNIFIQKQITLRPRIIKLIKENLDKDQENSLGYKI
jgi:hypothetical protein